MKPFWKLRTGMARARASPSQTPITEHYKRQQAGSRRRRRRGFFDGEREMKLQLLNLNRRDTREKYKATIIKTQPFSYRVALLFFLLVNSFFFPFFLLTV